MTLFVNFIAPPPVPKLEETPKLPKPRHLEKSQPRQLAAETAVALPSDYAIPAPPPAPAIEAPPAPAPAPELIKLGTELSVNCPERPAPAYPQLSRRLGEEGEVLLRVELDEKGLLLSARLASSSGYPRLDDAALAAIRNWRCTPALRNGQPLHAVALQAFKFILQGK